MRHYILKDERSLHDTLTRRPTVARTGRERGPGMASCALPRGAPTLCTSAAGPPVGHRSLAPGFVPARSRYLVTPGRCLASSKTAVVDLAPGQADSRCWRARPRTLYPLRIAARVFALLGIAALFYALVLVAIFVRSDIVGF